MIRPDSPALQAGAGRREDCPAVGSFDRLEKISFCRRVCIAGEPVLY